MWMVPLIHLKKDLYDKPVEFENVKMKFLTGLDGE